VWAEGLDRRQTRGVEREPPSSGAPVAASEAGAALIEVPGGEEATHKLVPLEDAVRLTGLGRDAVLQRADTQHLVSIDSGGKRSEFVLMPIALLGLEPEGGHDLPEQERVVVSVGPGGAVVHLSKQECWELYVLLADDAPFVRHQLSVVRNGGPGRVSLTTPAERRQVLASLLSGADEASTGGLAALRAAIAEARGDAEPDELVRG
jgi:hypothetical protein